MRFFAGTNVVMVLSTTWITSTFAAPIPPIPPIIAPSNFARDDLDPAPNLEETWSSPPYRHSASGNMRPALVARDYPTTSCHSWGGCGVSEQQQQRSQLLHQRSLEELLDSLHRRDFHVSNEHGDVLPVVWAHLDGRDDHYRYYRHEKRLLFLSGAKKAASAVASKIHKKPPPQHAPGSAAPPPGANHPSPHPQGHDQPSPHPPPGHDGHPPSYSPHPPPGHDGSPPSYSPHPPPGHDGHPPNYAQHPGAPPVPPKSDKLQTTANVAMVGSVVMMVPSMMKGDGDKEAAAAAGVPPAANDPAPAYTPGAAPPTYDSATAPPPAYSEPAPAAPTNATAPVTPAANAPAATAPVAQATASNVASGTSPGAAPTGAPTTLPPGTYSVA